MIDTHKGHLEVDWTQQATTTSTQTHKAEFARLEKGVDGYT